MSNLQHGSEEKEITRVTIYSGPDASRLRSRHKRQRSYFLNKFSNARRASSALAEPVSFSTAILIE